MTTRNRGAKPATHGGPTDDGSGPAVGHNLDIPRAQIPQPNGVLPPLPADNARAAYSDRIVVLDGNGEGHGDYHTADRTIENLRKYKDQPFFIACGFVKPHSPPTAPQKFFDLYDVDKIKLPPDFAAWPTVPPGFPSAAIRKRNADLFIGRGASEAEAREVIRAYLASISWADWNLGRVIAELDRLGLRENTIIVFVADHGYQLGEKGKWSKAGSLFEMGTRVPLIISAPGANGNGASCPRIVESLDIYPTLVELCGLPPQKEIEGASLAPLLKKPSAKWDKPGFSIWSEDGKTIHGTAVRTEQWRYAEFGKNGSERRDAARRARSGRIEKPGRRPEIQIRRRRTFGADAKICGDFGLKVAPASPRCVFVSGFSDGETHRRTPVPLFFKKGSPGWR